MNMPFRDMEEQGTFHAGREYERDILTKRIAELEGKIQSAKDIVSSQSFWCELADQECVGLKSIVHLVEQALKGGK